MKEKFIKWLQKNLETGDYIILRDGDYLFGFSYNTENRLYPIKIVGSDCAYAIEFLVNDRIKPNDKFIHIQDITTELNGKYFGFK